MLTCYVQERICMKYIRILLFTLFFSPLAAFAASNEFMVAAQLLAAAKNADVQQVQILINSGADVNFVDSTGLSIVCTALMNNDVRAAQILQMYGADASQCDAQIKKYNSRSKPKRTGGLFSGLSSAQSISLAAAGAAVVVGGLFLLTDVFDPGNDNDNGSSGGDRPDNNNGGGDTPTANVAFTLPYGPAMPNATSESANYVNNLNFYSPDNKDSIYYKNFQLMNVLGANAQGQGGQNYLLMMHGYSPLARGYMGMRTLRNLATREPISLTGNNLGNEPVMGGRPVNVALISKNGVDAQAGTSLEDRILLWTTLNNNGTTANGASNEMISSKYYNNKIIRDGDNTTISGDKTVEDSAFVGDFDLSGYGTAINNSGASANDNLLAKIIGGRDSGYANADYFGFMPNGQMSVFRTGGGRVMKDVTDAARDGGYTKSANGVLETLTLFGKTLNVTMGTGSTFTASITEGDVTTTYNGYIGANDLVYISDTAGGTINLGYTMGDNGKLVLAKELDETSDYLNYRALFKAAALAAAGDLPDNSGRSRVDIIANAEVIMPLRSKDTETINSILLPTTEARQTAFLTLVNKYYDVDENDSITGNALPSSDAASFFNSLGSLYQPLVLFSTGSFETDSLYSDETRLATFENAAPLVFNNLEHLFMSVVAVGMTGTGTGGTKTVGGYSPAGKIALSQWGDNNGTADVTTDDKYYKARVCGIAGRGANGIDPWCFAAAGLTDEMAVSSAAGAAGAVKSAFSYLNNKQLFALLALTADGPYLGSSTDGTALTKDALRSYLQGMYQMPADYQFRWEHGGEEYLDVFKEVFGYGLINLERATKPNTKVFYYNGDDIVSANGNAYWRAASNTVFRSSGAFNPRGASISAPFYDVLESVDGEMAMPRIWENEFALGVQSKRGLYMGDVLGELRTRDAMPNRTQIGNVGFAMTISDRPYADNMGGLDNLVLDFTHDNWNFAAGYQRYFTDGASRFDGMANPIFALASNAVTSDVKYERGAWSVGARAFSAAITDEELLDSDPTISSQFNPAEIGLMHGAAFEAGWNGDKFGFSAGVGTVRETNTILGAQTGGLLNLGGGNTTYVDTQFRYAPSNNVAFTMRSTFAKTTTDASGAYVLGMTDVTSNAVALGADVGGFSFAVSRPLAVTDGAMKYAHADYEIVETPDGKYDLNISNMHVADLDLAPRTRELRFNASYKHNFGEWTDGAIGFIYRVNPNNTDEFGNESIFMLKMTHRLGI